MVKECLVKLNNDAVTVVRFGDTDIQFPSIHKDAKTVFVSYEDGKYSIVDKNYKPKSADKPRKKGTDKKTTIDESVEEKEVITDTTVTETENA